VENSHIWIMYLINPILYINVKQWSQYIAPVIVNIKGWTIKKLWFDFHKGQEIFLFTKILRLALCPPFGY